MRETASLLSHVTNKHTLILPQGSDGFPWHIQQRRLLLHVTVMEAVAEKKLLAHSCSSFSSHTVLPLTMPANSPPSPPCAWPSPSVSGNRPFHKKKKSQLYRDAVFLVPRLRENCAIKK